MEHVMSAPLVTPLFIDLEVGGQRTFWDPEELTGYGTLPF